MRPSSLSDDYLQLIIHTASRFSQPYFSSWQYHAQLLCVPSSFEDDSEDVWKRPSQLESFYPNNIPANETLERSPTCGIHGLPQAITVGRISWCAVSIMVYPSATPYETLTFRLARQPVSAKILSEKYTGAGKVRKTSKESMASPNSSTLTRTRSAFRHVLRYVRPRPPSRPSAPSRTESDSSVDPAPSAIPTIGDTSLEDARLQVSVLIAMPNPYRPHGSETVTKGKARGYDVDGEDEVPDVMFGIAELPWKVRSTESN